MTEVDFHTPEKWTVGTSTPTMHCESRPYSMFFTVIHNSKIRRSNQSIQFVFFFFNDELKTHYSLQGTGAGVSIWHVDLSWHTYLFLQWLWNICGDVLVTYWASTGVAIHSPQHIAISGQGKLSHQLSTAMNINSMIDIYSKLLLMFSLLNDLRLAIWTTLTPFSCAWLLWTENGPLYSPSF